jgi:hypothetical protein
MKKKKESEINFTGSWVHCSKSLLTVIIGFSMWPGFAKVF